MCNIDFLEALLAIIMLSNSCVCVDDGVYELERSEYDPVLLCPGESHKTGSRLRAIRSGQGNSVI